MFKKEEKSGFSGSGERRPSDLMRGPGRFSLRLKPSLGRYTLSHWSIIWKSVSHWSVVPGRFSLRLKPSLGRYTLPHWSIIWKSVSHWSVVPGRFSLRLKPSLGRYMLSHWTIIWKSVSHWSAGTRFPIGQSSERVSLIGQLFRAESESLWGSNLLYAGACFPIGQSSERVSLISSLFREDSLWDSNLL